jgi:hypothetical protein
MRRIEKTAERLKLLSTRGRKRIKRLSIFGARNAPYFSIIAIEKMNTKGVIL